MIVRHSQSVSASPLHPWVAAERCGIIVCCHCTCMAGLGEACSHIAALMFAAETYNRLNKDVSCISQACTWLPPTNIQNVKYAPISDINLLPHLQKEKSLMVNLLTYHKIKFLCHLLKKRFRVFSMIYQKLGSLRYYQLSQNTLMLMW